MSGNYLKYGDLTFEEREKCFQYLYALDENTEAMFEDMVYSRYAARYLCCNSYEVFYNIIHNKLTEIQEPLAKAMELYSFKKQDTIISPYLEKFESTNDTLNNTSRTVSDIGTSDSTNNTTTSEEQSGTSNNKRIDTSITEVTDTGNEKHKTDDKTTATSVKTGSESDSGHTSDTNTKTGTVEHSKRGTETTSYSGSESVTDNGSNKQIGVKTTSVSPSATFTTKTIKSNIDTPMSTTSALGMTGLDPKGTTNDLITSTTPTSMDTTKLSNAEQVVNFSSLDRESDGSYKKNITTETYGSGSTPLTTETTGKQVKEFNSRTDSKDYSSTDTDTYNTTDTSNGTQDNTHTYNNVRDEQTGTSKLDQTTEKTGTQRTEHKDSESSGNYVEDKGTTSHTTEGTVASKGSTNHTNTTEDTGKSTGNTKATSSRSGYLGNDRIDKMRTAYTFYVELQPIIQHFVNYLEPCFAAVYEGLDDREWWQYGENT